MSKDNIIYTDNDEAIGFYNDLYKIFVEQIINLLNGRDIVSDNNGMGFTATKYEPKGKE